MVNSRTIYIDDIVPILLEHSTRAKRIIIKIKPNKEVKVAVPTRVSFETALEFVNKNEPWIRTILIKVQQQVHNQKGLADLISNIDKPEAEKTLINRLHVLAKKHGFTFSKVTIRNQKTRWGSCSDRGSISLNIKLIILPEELLDYVILHELVHTRIHDHSKRFWAELDKLVGNGKGKAMASSLRKYGGSLS